MIIKFKNGYTVHVTDHEGVDKAEIIEQAHFLVNNLKIKDGPVTQHTALAQKQKLSQMKEEDLIKEIDRISKLSKKNSKDKNMMIYLRNLKEEYKRRHPEPKQEESTDEEKDKKEKLSLLRFVLSNSINGLIAKGFEPDIEDIKKANKMAKELGVGIKKSGKKYIISKTSYDPMPSDYFDRALRGYTPEQAKNDYDLSNQQIEEIAEKSSDVFVDRIDKLAKKLSSILSSVYKDIKKYMSESDEHPVYDFGDHENSVSVDKISNFVVSVYVGIYALSKMMTRYNALFGKSKDKPEIDESVDNTFEETLKNLDTLRNKVFYFIDADRVNIPLL